MTRRRIYLVAAGLLVAIGLGVAGFHFRGQRAEIPAEAMPFVEEGPERAAFVTSAMSSCAREMVGKEALGRHLSDDEIETYCRCYANGMADRVTADDVRQMVAGGEPMAILRDKAVRVLQSCGEFLPAK
ncbi:MAG TPA: hypothetical protein VGP50_09360 [Stellaceae bacterium]|jgi:hypothetical protein|nr:hypothetical protein [Stellaceae bacterium]